MDYGFRILKNMDYGMDMDLVLNPSGPTGYSYSRRPIKLSSSITFPPYVVCRYVPSFENIFTLLAPRSLIIKFSSVQT